MFVYVVKNNNFDLMFYCKLDFLQKNYVQSFLIFLCGTVPLLRAAEASASGHME